MKNFLLIPVLLITAIASYPQLPGSVYVYFDFNRHELTTASRATLDSLTDSLDIADRIELHGHCDAKGSDIYNIRLSEKRVKAVENYLLSNGWEKKDIVIVQAHGKRRPLNDNATDEARRLNRRVEIRILKNPDLTKTTLKQQLSDSLLKAGDNIVLQNIHFEGGMHRFLPSSQTALQELLDAMKTYPKLVIRVEGHICCQPGTGDGPDIETGLSNLSEARARAVMEYLVRNGINQQRVSFKGFGHSMPLHPYPENNDQERMENRRVEIKILKK